MLMVSGLVAVAKPVRDTLRSRTDKEIARIVTSPQALQNLPSALQQRPMFLSEGTR
jgi:hypothetical protein